MSLRGDIVYGQSRRRPWRIVRVGVLVTVGVAGLCLGSPPPAGIGETGRVAGEANGWSFESSISANGRFVAFASDATNLVPGDTNDATDVFVRDRVTGTTRLVSVSSTGVQGNGRSEEPSISADGSTVAFISEANNLVPHDTNWGWEVFVHDLKTGRTVRSSVSSTERQANNESYEPVLSADGQIVAFRSFASNLVRRDTNRVTDVFVRNRVTGRTRRVNVSTTGAQTSRPSGAPALSADGRLVAFNSEASNLVQHDTNNAVDVFVHNRATGRTRLVSRSSRGVLGNGESGLGALFAAGALSADNRFVVFASAATNLVRGDTNKAGDVFVRDRLDHTTRLASRSSSGAQGGFDSTGGSISANGRFVAFWSFAHNLVRGDTNEADDVFVRDLRNRTTRRVSLSSTGAQADSDCEPAFISANGRFVVFESEATNLVPGDTNDSSDIFVRDLLTGTTERVSVSTDS